MSGLSLCSAMPTESAENNVDVGRFDKGDSGSKSDESAVSKRTSVTNDNVNIKVMHGFRSIFIR